MKYVINKICIDKWRFTNKVVLVDSDIIEHVLNYVIIEDKVLKYYQNAT
jgi:hypothetical protein